MVVPQRPSVVPGVDKGRPPLCFGILGHTRVRLERGQAFAQHRDQEHRCWQRQRRLLGKRVETGECGSGRLCEDLGYHIPCMRNAGTKLEQYTDR